MWALSQRRAPHPAFPRVELWLGRAVCQGGGPVTGLSLSSPGRVIARCLVLSEEPAAWKTFNRIFPV